MGDLSAKLIGFFEGFEPVAKWDVNAWRLGFGSDTEGPEQRPVTRHMTTTVERALANLSARLPKFEAVASYQVGAEWAKFPDNVKAALVSIAYNYGKLPDHVAEAAKAGNLSAVSKAIEDCETDNHGVNAKRRFAEAAFVASCE
ncbi:MAG: hypothetical protein P4M15_08610 [Alphaproteobacteria bacterium]|nr:hypothetical protein [Alphaproteobacteria bacterium]